jgi:transcription antitermination protein NusB
MRIETRARARALQALYAWEMRGEQNLDRVATQVWDDLAVTPEERRIAGLLVRAVANAGPELDSRLADRTTNWRLERLGAIERSVLRLGAAELLKGDTPPRVAIQEAVRLAERFGTSASAKFVNGVLDAFARQAGMIGRTLPILRPVARNFISSKSSVELSPAGIRSICCAVAGQMCRVE